MKKILLIILVFCIPFIGFSQEEQNQSDKWEWDVTPYLWGVGMKGDLTVGSENSAVDLGLSDIMKDLKLAGMLHVEAKKGKWSIMTDIFYAKLKQEVVYENTYNIEATVQQTFIELGGGYSFIKQNRFKVDALFGARYFDINVDLNIDNTNALNSDDNFIDPYVGLRFSNYWNKFGVAGRVDVGGFGVGSEISYKYNLLATYQFSKLFELALGYQAYNPYYDNGIDLIYDLSSEGFLLGFNFNF